MFPVDPLENLAPPTVPDRHSTGLPGHPPLLGPGGEYFGHEWARWSYDTLDARVDDALRTRPGPASILDLGCATGARAADFARAGHQVTAVDCVDRSALITERNDALWADKISPIIFVEGDLRQPSTFSSRAPYDLIHLRRVLNFITLDQFSASLRATLPLLRQNGRLVASFIASGISDAGEMTQPARHDTRKGWTVYPGFYVHDFVDVVGVLDDLGMTVLEAFSDWTIEAGLIAAMRSACPPGGPG